MSSPANRLLQHSKIASTTGLTRFRIMNRLIFTSPTSPAILGRPSTSGFQWRSLVSGHGEESSSKGTHPSAQQPNQGKSAFQGMWEHHKPSYRPGTDTYAYDNPWPKLNKSRLDWLFQDGWRRPLAKDQGAKLRRNWIPFGWNAQDEHRDWVEWHRWNFWTLTFCLVWFTAFIYNWMPDTLIGDRDWAQREAFLELARREAQGLPLISKDYIEPSRVIASLPSDEELGSAKIII